MPKLTKVAANIYNQPAEDVLISPQTGDRARSRLLKDPQASTTGAVANPADKPGGGFSDGNIWFGYTYQQGPGKIRDAFGSRWRITRWPNPW